MIGLIYRDMINLKASMKSMLLSYAVIIVVFCMIKQGMVAMMVTPVLFSYIVAGTFQCDASVKWNKICLTMPLKTSTIVLSRYVEFIILLLIGLLVGTIFGCIYLNLIAVSTLNDSFSFANALAVAIVIPVSYAILFFPVAYYFKGEKMDMTMMVCLVIMFVLFGGGAMLMKYTSVSFQYNDLDLYIYIFLIISVLLFILSYFVSLSIFKRKS